MLCICRYLSQYEKVYSGKDTDGDGDDGDMGGIMGPHRRHKVTMTTVPMRYNYTQHNVPGKMSNHLAHRSVS